MTEISTNQKRENSSNSSMSSAAERITKQGEIHPEPVINSKQSKDMKHTIVITNPESVRVAEIEVYQSIITGSYFKLPKPPYNTKKIRTKVLKVCCFSIVDFERDIRRWLKKYKGEDSVIKFLPARLRNREETELELQVREILSMIINKMTDGKRKPDHLATGESDSEDS